MGVSDKRLIELIEKDWAAVDGEKSLFINKTLFSRGMISLLDPALCEAPILSFDKPFAISKERSLLFIKDEKISKIAKKFFDLPSIKVGLRHAKRRDELYIPVMITDEQGLVASGLYIHPRTLGEDDSQAELKPFTAFHAETCLLGSQLSCKTDKGSIRHFTKHHVEFFSGERIMSIISAPGDNSYETMQFEELQLMAIIMASYSMKGLDGKPMAEVTHHLPWLDYILSGALLWNQGHMTYQALHSLCEIMLSKKLEHEKKIGTIYHALGLAYRFITPFDNLLDPMKAVTADSILEQLGINEKDEQATYEDAHLELANALSTILKLSKNQESPAANQNIQDPDLLQALYLKLQQTNDEKRKGLDKAFVTKYIHLLINNNYNPEQKAWWSKLIASKIAAGEDLNTLESLLEIANALALAIATPPSSLEAKPSNVCSFVSIQGKQIQVVYEKLFKLSGAQLPPVTFWTSLPLFMTTSEATPGATFYFDYLAHAGAISKLIERNIVGGAISNMAAWMRGEEGVSVKKYLSSPMDPSKLQCFFRPISDKTTQNLALTPGKTGYQPPAMFFQIEGDGYYDPDMNDESIIIGWDGIGEPPKDLVVFGQWSKLS